MGVITSITYAIVFIGVVCSTSHYGFGNDLIYYGMISAVIVNIAQLGIRLYDKQRTDALLCGGIAAIFSALCVFFSGAEFYTAIYSIGIALCMWYMFSNFRKDKSIYVASSIVALAIALLPLLLFSLGNGLPSYVSWFVIVVLSVYVLWSIFSKYINASKSNEVPGREYKLIGANLNAIVAIGILLTATGSIPSLYSDAPQPGKTALENMEQGERKSIESKISRAYSLADKIMEK